MKGLREPWATRGLAAGVFLVGFFTLLHAMVGASLTRDVPVNVARGYVEGRAYPKGFADETDHQFVIWLAARNARVLVTEPQHLFDAEPCHPTEHALALGEPGISMGLMGIPAWVISGDPIATYNFVFGLVCLVSFAAMFLLVREWTGSTAAALVAALLFTFHEVKIKDSVHFFAWDGSWTVLALYFTTRLARDHRWRDAMGLSFAIAMQLAGSFYPLLAAAVIAPPVLVWLAIRHGVREQRPLQWGLPVLAVVVVAALVFAPYLAKTDAGVLSDRSYQIFLNFEWLLPGGPAFPGWVQLLLVIVALALPRRLATGGEGRPDPRWTMLVIAVLLVGISAGGNTVARLEALQRGDPLPPAFPDLYAGLAALVPGLKQIRGPAALYSGVHVALCVIAGVGVAGLLRAVPERMRTATAAGGVVLTWIELMRPALLGLDPRIDYVAIDVRPPAEEIAFLDGLRSMGSTGPLLELPFNPRNLRQAARATLLVAWHGRRTAQCYNSYFPPETLEVKAIADRLPEREAVSELASLGFTTILVREAGDPAKRKLSREWRRDLAPAVDEGTLALLREGEAIAAYRIVPEHPTAPPAADELPANE